MACDCHKDVKEKLLVRFKEYAPEAKNHSAAMQGYTIILGDKLEEKGYMPVKCDAEYPLKKGGFKGKTITQNMVFTFCPFCGVKY